MGTVHQLGADANIDRVVMLASLLRLNARPGNKPATAFEVRRRGRFTGHRFTSDADVAAVQAANPTLIALVGGAYRLTPEGLRQARERPNPRYAVQ